MNRPDWRKFELLVAAVEERLAPKGAAIKSPDRLRDIDTGRWREVDATIRLPVGSAEILIAIECRKRKGPADVTWIEQLATKRTKVGADKIIAVSSAGFSHAARKTAAKYSIELRTLDHITSQVIDDWAMPESLVHTYCVVDSLRCSVTLRSGEVIEIEEMDPCFTHPTVNGNFPPSAFVSFMEMKDPEIIWGQSVEEGRELTFTLDASDPDLIPVPLGELRRKGELQILVDGVPCSIDKIDLALMASRQTQVIPTSQGRHFTYGPPDEPVTAMSQFEGEIAGVPVTIERMKHPGAPPSAVAAFPNGLKLPSQLLRPYITDMSTVDLEVLHNQPIRISVRPEVDNEGNAFGSSIAEGILFRPLIDFFENGEHRRDFNRRYLMFLTHADVKAIRDGAEESETSRNFWKLVSVFPHEAIEYIDLSPLLATLGNRRNRRRRGRSKA